MTNKTELEKAEEEVNKSEEACRVADSDGILEIVRAALEVHINNLQIYNKLLKENHD